MDSVRDDVGLRVFDMAKRLKSVFTHDGQKTRCITRVISHERLNRIDSQECVSFVRGVTALARICAGIWDAILLPWNGRARLNVIIKEKHFRARLLRKREMYNYRKMLKPHPFASFAFLENIRQNRFNLFNFRRRDCELIIHDRLAKKRKQEQLH